MRITSLIGIIILIHISLVSSLSYNYFQNVASGNYLNVVGNTFSQNTTQMKISISFPSYPQVIKTVTDNVNSPTTFSYLKGNSGVGSYPEQDSYVDLTQLWIYDYSSQIYTSFKSWMYNTYLNSDSSGRLTFVTNLTNTAMWEISTVTPSPGNIYYAFQNYQYPNLYLHMDNDGHTVNAEPYDTSILSEFLFIIDTDWVINIGAGGNWLRVNATNNLYSASGTVGNEGIWIKNPRDTNWAFIGPHGGYLQVSSGTTLSMSASGYPGYCQNQTIWTIPNFA